MLVEVLRRPVLKRYAFGFRAWICQAPQRIDLPLALALQRMAQLLAERLRARAAQLFERWRTVAAVGGGWQQHHEAFRREVHSLADEDAAVSLELMACAEKAAARAGRCSLLAAVGRLARLHQGRLTWAMLRWQGQGQRLERLVRLTWAWHLWRSWRPQRCQETQTEVEEHPLARRAEDLLRLKVRLASHAGTLR